MLLARRGLTGLRLHSLASRAASGGPGRRVGAALDVDGVLKRGARALPGAAASIEKLRGHGVPLTLLTNGGSVLERDFAVSISRLLGVQIHEEEVILGHTPMQELAKHFADDLVLVVGSERAYDVALSYGFARPVLPSQLARLEGPTRWPFSYVHRAGGEAERVLGLAPLDAMKKDPGAFEFEKIKAVFVLSDGWDWGTELQTVCDALLLGHHVPIHFASSDLVWSNEMAMPRFGQGAFRSCVEGLYRGLTGDELQAVLFGKPQRRQYDFALRRLQELAGHELDAVYMVGDNPRSDIAGANGAGDKWCSVLVQTGVFQKDPARGIDNDADDPADAVVADVRAAVDLIVSDST